MKKNIIIPIFFLFLKINFAISDDKFLLGKDIFLNAGNCSACHSLQDAGSAANVGPNLNEIKPDIGRVIISVTNGAGVMPSYLGILSQEEIEAVAYYVAEASVN